MLLLVLTSYLFFQGPRLWAWRNFFLSLKAIPCFRPLSVVRPTQVFTYSKKSYEEGNYTYFQYSQCFVIFFSLFTFEFNHVLSFPGSACYYAEVLGLPVRDSAPFLFFFFGSFSFPSDRQAQTQGTHSTVNEKSKWLKAEVALLNNTLLTSFLGPFPWRGRGKGPETKVEHTVIYVFGSVL